MAGWSSSPARRESARALRPRVRGRRRGRPRPVAVGACDGSPTPPPLGPLVELLPALPADVWPAGADQLRGLHPAGRRAAQPAHAAPYLLVIEDAHWADEATLDLLRHLARRIHTCRALVLVTYRPEDLPRGPRAAPAARRGRRAPPACGGWTSPRCRGPPSGPWPGSTAWRRGRDIERLTGSPTATRSSSPRCSRPAAAHVRRTCGTPCWPGSPGCRPPARRTVDVVALAGAARRARPARRPPRRRPRGDRRTAGARDPAGSRAASVTFRHELARLAVASQMPAFRRMALHRRILAALTRPRTAPGRPGAAGPPRGRGRPTTLDVVTGYGTNRRRRGRPRWARTSRRCSSTNGCCGTRDGLDDAGRADCWGSSATSATSPAWSTPPWSRGTEQLRLLATLGDARTGGTRSGGCPGWNGWQGAAPSPSGMRRPPSRSSRGPGPSNWRWRTATWRSCGCSAATSPGRGVGRPGAASC